MSDALSSYKFHDESHKFAKSSTTETLLQFYEKTFL